jgi:rod shape-determining protein MreD
MRALRLALALAVAAAIHFAGMELFPWFSQAVDLFLVILVFHAMDGNTSAGMLGGCAAGLLTDALTGSPFGLFSLADTVVGYGTAVTAQRLVIQRASSSLLVFSLGAAAQQVLVLGISLLLLPDPEVPEIAWVTVRVATSGILGLGLYLSSTRARGKLDEWRRTRTAKIRFER